MWGTHDRHGRCFQDLQQSKGAELRLQQELQQSRAQLQALEESVHWADGQLASAMQERGELERQLQETQQQQQLQQQEHAKQLNVLGQVPHTCLSVGGGGDAGGLEPWVACARGCGRGQGVGGGAWAVAWQGLSRSRAGLQRSCGQLDSHDPSLYQCCAVLPYAADALCCAMQQTPCAVLRHSPPTPCYALMPLVPVQCRCPVTPQSHALLRRTVLYLPTTPSATLCPPQLPSQSD